jgi:predicted NACHT family NTPase
MLKQTYNWKRFWCSRTARIDLSDHGYLVDPESEWGRHANPELVGLESIADVPCLVLLGEPGIGKSEVIKKATEIKTYNQDLLVLDLHSYGSEDRLVKDLFESSQFSAWDKDIHTLHIFLDSLDECLLRIDNVTALLAEKFKRHQDKVDRLFLRIICRTAVWQSSFEKQLQQIWGEDKVKVYELAPLRWLDVRHAAEREGIKNPDLFMKEILGKRVVPLAVKPITLGFLLNIYRRNGRFSQQQTLFDLYLEGCRILCDEEEDKPDFLLPGRKGNLELDQRLIIAARIAAVTVFANRDAVWTGRNRGQIPEDDVQSPELAQGYERANARQFEASEASITEVLNTGLFSSCGANRMGWAHQTYAQFLAAWYLKQHNLNLSQTLNLIIHPDGRVIPQLQETTAWLASMMPEVFQEVMKTDPDVLLQSDISAIDDENKAQLVESLLKFHDEGKLEYFRFWRYNNLDHPGLPGQLEFYIRDSSRNQWARLVAIDIAQDCNVKAVQDCLTDIALDPTQLHIVRTHTAYTVCAMGDEETKARLKPLAVGEAGDNPNDDLKGYALRAVWSQHITVEELLEHLSQPNQKGAFPIIGGVYQDFIATEFAEHLRLSDLPVALKWLEQLPRRYDLHYPFRELADSVMLKAWQNLNEPGVLEAFANVAILRLKQHDGILGDRPHREYTLESFERTRDADVESSLGNSDRKRRQLIETIVLLISESESDFLWLTNIVCSEDILWIIERITSTESPKIVDVWVKLLSQALSWHNLYWKNTRHIDTILEARNISPAMRSEFEIEIELGSEKAKQAKAIYLQYQNCSKSSDSEPTLDPPPKQREIAKSSLPEKVPEFGEARNKAIVAARLLANYPDNSSWSVFWLAVQEDHEFGREVLESIAFQAARQGQIEQKIKEDYLADLYIFLAQQYPEIKQHKPETQELRGIEAQIPREFDDVRLWKNYIPQRLQARGTPEACDALRKIICELPEQKEQLQPMLLEAEGLARRNTWRPPKPEEILQLVISREPSTSDLFNQLNVIEQKMSEQPSIQIGSISGGINNFTPNQGTQNLTQIETQNNYATDPSLLQTIQDLLQQNTDLKNFITNLETQNPNLLTETEAEVTRDKAIANLQNNNPILWKNIRAQMRTFKRQLLNPERHAQATKATIVEVTKTYWEKSLIAKAIITYIDKLSETPDQGA